MHIRQIQTGKTNVAPKQIRILALNFSMKSCIHNEGESVGFPMDDKPGSVVKEARQSGQADSRRCTPKYSEALESNRTSTETSI